MCEFRDPIAEMPPEFHVVEITGGCSTGRWLCKAQAVLVKDEGVDAFENECGQKWTFVKRVNGVLRRYKAGDVKGWRYLA